ncbi:MAG: sulfotransferase [Balneolaceae bacterium]|nr:sulfotransferase [Balneolaceae bacterium]
MPSLAYQTYRAANAGLGVLERFVKTSDNLPSPVFIIGAPRSGSTLIYQAVVAEFGFSYLSNRHCTWFGAPWLIEQYTDALSNYRNSLSFDSKFGGTKGWYSPSECGNYWYRFFQKHPQFVSKKSFSEKAAKALQQSVSVLSKSANKPILFKNLMNVLRLEPLLDVFPNALFIVIERSPIDIAHSILEARFKLYQDYNEWFSVEVPNIQALKNEPPEVQVVEQIRSIYQLIQRQASTHPSQFMTLNYEQFCATPNKVIEKLQEFFEKHDLNTDQISLLPDSFSLRREVRIEKSLYQSLQNYLAEYPISL